MGLKEYTMDDTTRQRLIDYISWGKILIDEQILDGTPIQLILHTPSIETKARSALIYQSAYKQARQDKVLPQEALIEHYIVLGRWNPEIDLEIQGIQDDIRKMTKGLLDYIFQTDKLEKIRLTIRNAEKALMERTIKRHELTQSSAEAHALTIQQRFVISQITTNVDNNRYWSTVKSFEDERDTDLVNRLVAVFYEGSMISVKNIRNIARNHPWRGIWMSGKTSDNLFNCCVSERSKAQADLCYWSRIYDNVFEAFERPIQQIIDDDDLLDSWFLRQADQIDKKSRESLMPKSKSSTSSKPGRQEQFVLTSSEGAKQIYDMNDNLTRAKLKSKQQLIKKHKKIKEQKMPDSQLEMRQLAVQQFKDKIKKRG